MSNRINRRRIRQCDSLVWCNGRKDGMTLAAGLRALAWLRSVHAMARRDWERYCATVKP